MGINKLKYVTPELNISDNIAVIGSGDIIRKNNFSKQIDQYDDVVRFNRAPTENFEHIVGSKTTIRVANQHVFANIPFDRPGALQIADFIRKQENCQILHLANSSLGWHNKDKHIHPSSTAYIVDYQKIKIEGIQKLPTVGIAFVWLCIQSGVIPHLYGYSTHQDDKLSHYWEVRDNKSVYHDHSIERNLLLKWEKEGKIKIFQ